ncbi:MFS transporter [Cysteiniphilum sp. QT6929]|uniref:MFS transporter n=1 Tax=Cysteiniphilum sp. QT6929 TaxID=2975055 RepID=UPI0024B39A60|nr:MFS transporter [Cysteiniphilum sp. QT6929]WHN66074.1 MFS transporter [Cysteiniphilum sp. QT6929]
MLLKSEKKSTLSIASIYAFRMLGLFIILPIFSLYADKIIDATPTLIGVALGIYGLTQALLQIVLGVLSDKYGRKPVILFGLIVFIIGSVVAAMSHTIYGIIIGRALQGAGAIGSTLTALVADTTKEENRMKAMSVIGMTIGLSFIGAMVLGPILNTWIGLSGIFWLTAILGAIGIVILIYGVPTPTKIIFHKGSETTPSQIKSVLKKPELLRLNYGIFSLHAMLTALFLAIPVILIDYIGVSIDKQWIIYLPVLFISFFLMVPFIIIAETKNLMKPVFIGAIIILTAMQFLLYEFDHHVIVMSVLLVLYFASFTLLEAALPSLISKMAPISSKGTAMGVYSSAQFFGIFFGGVLGGVIMHHFGIQGVFIFNGLLGVLWIVIAITMQKPKQLSSKLYSLNKAQHMDAKALQQQILNLPGVEEAMVCLNEGAAYLKVDKKIFDEVTLKSVL